MPRPLASRFRKVQVSLADLCAKREHSPAVLWDRDTIESLRARFARGAGTITSTDCAIERGAWTYEGALQQVQCCPVLGRIRVAIRPHGANLDTISWLVQA